MSSFSEGNRRERGGQMLLGDRLRGHREPGEKNGSESLYDIGEQTVKNIGESRERTQISSYIPFRNRQKKRILTGIVEGETGVQR